MQHYRPHIKHHMTIQIIQHGPKYVCDIHLMKLIHKTTIKLQEIVFDQTLCKRKIIQICTDSIIYVCIRCASSVCFDATQCLFLSPQILHHLIFTFLVRVKKQITFVVTQFGSIGPTCDESLMSRIDIKLNVSRFEKKIRSYIFSSYSIWQRLLGLPLSAIRYVLFCIFKLL